MLYCVGAVDYKVFINMVSEFCEVTKIAVKSV